MSIEQKRMINDVIKQLNTVRKDLDCIMYDSEPLTDTDYQRLRKCYDKICETIDNLY